MESTAPDAAPATVVVVPPDSLLAAFARVPDPRRQASVTYPLPAILALATAALLSAHTSVLAMAAWGARQSADLLEQLGFPDGRTPCQSTLQRLFAKLDGQALATALSAAFALASDPGDGVHGVAIDGKAYRGRLQYASGGPPVHALTAVAHEAGVVLAQQAIAQGADKAEAELTVAPALLAQLDWHGRVLTGDALFCQRALCQQVRAAGGDYLLLVRANQPSLHEAIQFLFDPPRRQDALPLTDRREVRTVERGHGRVAEVRHLLATTDLTTYLTDDFAWPDGAQVFRLERTWQEHGRTRRQVIYGLTSLPPALGSPARLLALKRGHWEIENGLHRTKDVSFGEDQSLIHRGQGPTVMAFLRDAAVSVLHHRGVRHIAARLRDYSQYPERAVALVREPLVAHA